jgi:hypothetical protein
MLDAREEAVYLAISKFCLEFIQPNGKSAIKEG